MKKELLNKMKGKMFVSCQGYDEKTFHTTEDMVMMANAAAIGGCFGFRVNSPENVQAVKKQFPNYPVIGIYKIEREDSEVYITPDVNAAKELVDAGADIIALDCTKRKNYLGDYGWETLNKAKKELPDVLFMADCATFEEAKLAVEFGADIISTTMSGYTHETEGRCDEPDFEMLRKCKEQCNAFIICEGRIWTREDALKAFEAGADAIVVGTAITNPKLITKRYIDFLKENKVWQ